MLQAPPLPLNEWDSFYVIIGSSAAALTGLQFVVVALGSDARRLGSAEALSAFGTPTIVHFCATLLVAAILSTPHQTASSLAICLMLIGIAGLVYITSVVRTARKQEGYLPVLEDWIWHSILPAVAYGAVLLAGALTWRFVGPALYVVAAASLLLLFIGIHNAWDAAVWIATHHGE